MAAAGLLDPLGPALAADGAGAPAAVLAALGAEAPGVLSWALFLVAVLVAAALLRWTVSFLLAARRIEKIAAAAERVAAGRLDIRTGLPHDDPAIGRLARSFDLMAAQLERRDQEHLAGLDALRASEERFARSFLLVPEVVTLSTLAEGRYLEVNDAFVRLTGHPREEVVGRTSTDLGFWADPAHRAQLSHQLEEKGEVHGAEVRVRLRDGRIVDGLLSMAVLEVDGRPAVLSTMHDITAYKALEQQFRQAQKMEAVGQLAGGIAHDFNNLLTVVGGHIEMLLARHGTDHRDHGDLVEIRRAASRAAALTAQLLAFSRQQVLQPQLIDLEAVVLGMAPMLRRLLGETIALETDFAGGGAWVWADPHQIEQILMNMVVNARDAMPRGGTLRIETGSAQLDEAYARVHPAVVAGDYRRLTISDTGIGMDRATAARVFEPFFTTKEAGRGTGLGLSTVYGIVKQSRGYIWVYSEPGRGTAFKIYLPRKEAPDQPRLPERVEAAATRDLHGDERILLVEDEAPVRELVREILELHGYHVEEAPDAEFALELLRAAPTGFALLLTDIVLPRMDGNELAHEARRLAPGMPILFTSGYTDLTVLREGMIEPGSTFLQKPFTPVALLSRVRHLLDSATIPAPRG